ncbi:uncharacterized protein LOC126598713 isoform X2 [Malus sylvestris]|uniref:uncharacterized protein LOC126598713 isoform X2 n=1 Tax=Malus sylvestris TaxID=3752 RepID=UPI0021AC1BF6|nr:uncharacterized protein LOC126598713 isoform X2 [Malus sylvestris]
MNSTIVLASWKSNHEAPYTSSDADRHFRSNFRPNHGDLAGVQVTGESDSFRGVFRSNHGELDVVRGEFNDGGSVIPIWYGVAPTVYGLRIEAYNPGIQALPHRHL